MGVWIGILFGVLPAWWSYSAIIIQTVIFERKIIPQWMIKIVFPNPFTEKYFLSIAPKKLYLAFLRFGPVVWVAMCLIGYHYIALVDYARRIISEIVLIETSFPVFLLLTWLLPVYILRQYVRRLKSDESTKNK